MQISRRLREPRASIFTAQASASDIKFLWKKAMPFLTLLPSRRTVIVICTEASDALERRLFGQTQQLSGRLGRRGGKFRGWSKLSSMGGFPQASLEKTLLSRYVVCLTRMRCSMPPSNLLEM